MYGIRRAHGCAGAGMWMYGIRRAHGCAGAGMWMYRQKIAPAFSALPPSMAVVSGGRMDAQEP